VSLQDSDLLPQQGETFSGGEAHLTLIQALPDASGVEGEESGGLQHPIIRVLYGAWMCSPAARGEQAQSILRAHPLST